MSEISASMITLLPVPVYPVKKHGEPRSKLHRTRKEFDAALVAYKKALQNDPSNATIHYEMANTLADVGRLELALISYGEALRIDPCNPVMLKNRAITRHEFGDLQAAIEDYETLCKVSPNDPEVFNDLGIVLTKLERFTDALASFDCAVELNPQYFVAFYNRGDTFSAINRLEAAITDYDRALSINPSFEAAWLRRGDALVNLKRHQESIRCYERVLSTIPLHIKANNNLGAVFNALGMLEKAAKFYDKALSISPAYSGARYNKSLLMLLLGDYQGGWALHESRLNMDDVKKKLPVFDEPRWDGCEDIIGKRLFIHEEQGLGDLIHFCRYVPALIDKGVEVFLETPKALAPLLKTLHPKVRLVLTGARPPDFDFYCPLMSLPFAAKTTLDTISGAAYLSSDKARVAQWKARIGESKAAQIGLVWSGNSAHRNDHHRSIELQDLLPILDKSHDWHSLQKEYRPNDIDVMECQTKIIQHQDELSDFADTAALIENLDLVITVDTSVAHLAGSLGKPVWILLPKVPDYRWMLDRSDTPWYRSARLYRQSALGDWTDVLEKVAGDIRKVTTDV